VKVDERRLTLHRQPKSGVVAMLRIIAAIAIAQDAGLAKVVVVGPRPIRNRRLVMLGGTSGSIASLKIPWGPSKGTRAPSRETARGIGR